ncbi:leucyl aminopeptidase [Pseudooceanicola nitratireducens]|uniref:leucyl aminopeptidase n=1 Tax=Pseudooceanicola nitratireducens TaxID=517719 RepID=UPI001C95F1B2|nr:leucyl aminopeptidase [Pseudooceanicola nitratireducens]MBY6166010.1 leucyl aminopeptidase [Pseudooceanicola nitratireducens]
MTNIATVDVVAADLDAIAQAKGRVAVVVGAEGRLSPAARRLNRLTRGAVKRLVESDTFTGAAAGDVLTIGWPQGMEAEALDILVLDRRASDDALRKAGASVGKGLIGKDLLLLPGTLRDTAELVEAMVLRAYDYTAQKTAEAKQPGTITVQASDPDALRAAVTPRLAVAEGVFFTRDLVSAPANVLTTTEFAKQLKDMEALGLKVEVLEEDALAALGMGALLAVGQGSDSPSKVVVMEWQGGGDEAPLALIGKGVVFDTGGISLKPAAGMEDMTMDMGGAGTVAGAMKALALRKAKANVVGLVGLVENMPSGNAMRPGDVITSMKGDTIEVTNTDAEGRLVLCDVMWYAQDRFEPAGMIDLATLTGAIIIGLGHHNAGVFSNDDGLCNALTKAAGAVGEGAWRMPLGDAYAKQLKSRIADVNNVGGRPAGSITAAEFLHRFVKDGTPWCHIDIAGVASVKAETTFAPAGATGWGVRALDQLVQSAFEGKKA